MPFLPQTYEPPQTGNYMRLQTGDNRLRAMGSAIVGNEFWTTDNGTRRPVRRRLDDVIEQNELGTDQHGQRERVKHFWAFAVWNCANKQVQILEITQRTIQDAIRALSESSDWGDPTQYDIIIKKSGSGLDTEYTVMPAPKSAPPKEAIAEYKKLAINLDALFDGEDPFKGGAANGTANGTTNGSSTAATGSDWAWSDYTRYAASHGITEVNLKKALKDAKIGKLSDAARQFTVDLCATMTKDINAPLEESDIPW